jgi:hypothetical protein
MYLRPWELDPDQPRIQGTSATVQLRHYRNLDGMPARLQELLTTRSYTGAAEYLGLLPMPAAHPSFANGRSEGAVAAAPAVLGAGDSRRRSPRQQQAHPVTLVVPCFNESQSLRYLQNTLTSLSVALEGEYAFTFLFVDDCSNDDTWEQLRQLFGGRPDCQLLRHDRNRGVAAAIQTGLRHASTEIVCSIDCDCTYDPHQLAHMIPLLQDGVDVVTASPYHPGGRVRNVPGWRLVLSRTLSRLYRLVLRQKLFTYTSCFRVYRKQSTVGLPVRRPGFLGIAEMIALVDQAGGRVIEYPATLEVRVLGHSKMKIARTIAGHLGLLLDVVRTRLSGRNVSRSVTHEA